jgi:hypothetical protein
MRLDWEFDRLLDTMGYGPWWDTETNVCDLGSGNVNGRTDEQTKERSTPFPSSRNDEDLGLNVNDMMASLSKHAELNEKYTGVLLRHYWVRDTMILVSEEFILRVGKVQVLALVFVL